MSRAHKVYVVIGESGNYPDEFDKWTVAVYAKRRDANKHAREANERVPTVRRRGQAKLIEPYDKAENVTAWYGEGIASDIKYSVVSVPGRGFGESES